MITLALARSLRRMMPWMLDFLSTALPLDPDAHSWLAESLTLSQPSHDNRALHAFALSKIAWRDSIHWPAATQIATLSLQSTVSSIWPITGIRVCVDKKWNASFAPPKPTTFQRNWQRSVPLIKFAGLSRSIFTFLSFLIKLFRPTEVRRLRQVRTHSSQLGAIGLEDVGSLPFGKSCGNSHKLRDSYVARLLSCLVSCS